MVSPGRCGRAKLRRHRRGICKPCAMPERVAFNADVSARCAKSPRWRHARAQFRRTVTAQCTNFSAPTRCTQLRAFLRTALREGWKRPARRRPGACEDRVAASGERHVLLALVADRPGATP